MARDFTDYVVEVHGAGDRVYYQRHYRQLKNDELVTEFEFNERTYLLNKDRAFRVKGYTPWKKWDKRHPLRSIKEITRGKKVGLVKYREPPHTEPQMVEVEIEVPVRFSCTLCSFETKHQNAMKGHVTRKHKGAKADMITDMETETKTELQPQVETVEPLHISRMHQPSGRMMTDEKIKDAQESDPKAVQDDDDDDGSGISSLLDIITPRLLKIEIEDDTYRKAYKSYKFGNIIPMSQKWWVLVAVVVVVVIVLLYMTGNIGGR